MVGESGTTPSAGPEVSSHAAPEVGSSPPAENPEIEWRLS